MTTTRRALLLAACLPAVIVVVLPIVLPSAGIGGLVRAIALLFVGSALLLFPIVEGEARPKARALIDGAIVGTAIWAICYQVISTVGMGHPTKPQAPMLLAYVLLGALTVGVAAALAVRVTRDFRKPAWLVVCGLLLSCVFATAQAAGYVSSAGSAEATVSIGLIVVSVLGAILQCAGLAGASRQEVAFDVDREEADPTWRRVISALPSAMIIVVIAMAGAMAFSGRTLSTVDYVTGLAFLGLLVIQQVVANREQLVLTAQLRSRGELFQSLVNGSSDLITLHDSTGRVLYASPAVYRLLKSDESEVINQSIWGVVHPDDRRGLEEAARDVLAAPGKTVEHVMRVRHLLSLRESYASGLPEGNWEWRWMQTAMHNLVEDENVRGVVCNTRDIHDQHELGQRLSHEAYHDALTGLGNLALARRIFADHSYGADRTPTTLILADLDGFKTLNDTFGHAFGDDLLVAVSRRLRMSVTDDDAIARIGGDEFVLIFDSEQEALDGAAAILEALNRPLLVKGTSVICHASMGIARSVDAHSSEELLRNADLAMYEAKAAGGNAFVSYDEKMFEQTSRRMQIQEGLRAAVENDRFELAFQPIMDLRTRTICGAEALLRWHDPDLGRVPPDFFIPVAESSGLIAVIDKWVLTAACKHINEWRARGLAVPTISINVSRRQITDGLESLIADVIAETGVNAGDLCIEVTESAVVPDPEAAARVLQGVRDMGALVALDDFGTGQSSLSQLSGLPIDRVKIDKSFVMPCSSDEAALDLLSSIVGLCRSLELPIVAEGIEDDQAAQNLVAMGAQFGQGYFFYRPMGAADFEDLIRVAIPGQRSAAVAGSFVDEVLAADEFKVIVDKEPSSADARNQE